LRLGVRADRTFLHDTEGVVQKDLEIQEYTDPRNDPMIPTRSCSSRRSLKAGRFGKRSAVRSWATVSRFTGHG
jgi:hypothetical protein